MTCCVELGVACATYGGGLYAEICWVWAIVCYIVRDISNVPETVVPDSTEGAMFLISSGFVSFVKYFGTLSDAGFLLIFFWRP